MLLELTLFRAISQVSGEWSLSAPNQKLMNSSLKLCLAKMICTVFRVWVIAFLPCFILTSFFLYIFYIDINTKVYIWPAKIRLMIVVCADVAVKRVCLPVCVCACASGAEYIVKLCLRCSSATLEGLTFYQPLYSSFPIYFSIIWRLSVYHFTRDLRIGNFRSNRISNRICGYDSNSNRISNRIRG